MRHLAIVRVRELQSVTPLALSVEKSRHALENIVVHLAEYPRRVAYSVESTPPFQQPVHPLYDGFDRKQHIARMRQSVNFTAHSHTITPLGSLAHAFSHCRARFSTLPSAMRISNADRSLSCGIVTKYEERSASYTFAFPSFTFRAKRLRRVHVGFRYHDALGHGRPFG